MEVDIDIFHPENDFESKQARRVCHMCDVQSECLAEVVAKAEYSDDNMYGIRGGFVPRARRRMVRERLAREEALARKTG